MKNPIRFGMTLAVIILLFLAFNLVWALKLPKLRLDLSSNKTHSLSASTTALLTTLESPVDLYFFNSNNYLQKRLDLKKYSERVTTLLKAYENAAKGKINLHLIDPAPFSEDAYKAGLLGLDDKHGFFGLVGTRVNQEPQRIEWFAPEREAFLEYEISRLIHNVVRQSQPVIGLISTLPMDSHRDERTQQAVPAWQLLQEIRQQFNLMSLAQDSQHIPEHVKTLMVVHSSQLPEKTLIAIEQFVLGGGKLLMFIDPLSEWNSTIATPSSLSSLKGLLAAWGVQIPMNKAVADSLYATSAILSSGQSPVQHPGALTLPREALAQNDISTMKLQNVRLLSSGAFKPLKKSRTTFTPLLHSSDRAALFDIERLTQPASFDSLIRDAAAQAQHHVLAARIQGPAYSAFAEVIDGQKRPLHNAANIHVVVVADTDLLSDRVWNSARSNNGQKTVRSDNATFVLNILDNLSAPDTLINVGAHASIHGPATPLDRLRADAGKAYREKAGLLEQRLIQTEKEWQSLTSSTSSFGTQATTSNTLLQALNKERLRLPMELHALKNETFRQVRQFEIRVELLTIVAMPVIVSLLGLGVFLMRRRRRHTPAAAFY
ncbi:Gldg family protein [Pseudomonas sp. 15FMM2]|uniref:Gldg family protein n=1 Tax=Pseudomonas imrae TaxID=2992837 RepID=A0ACC7PCI8_9PSED